MYCSSPCRQSKYRKRHRKVDSEYKKELVEIIIIKLEKIVKELKDL